MMDRLLNPIKSRIRLMIARAVISACKGSSVDIDLLAGESREDVDFYQQYGFTSKPKGNVKAIALFVGGSRDNGAVVACRGEDSDMDVDLEEGEVAVHSPFGSEIILKKDGSILLRSKDGSGKVRVEGNLNVTGGVLACEDVAAGCTDVEGTVVDAGAVHLQLHVHPSAVGPTSPSKGP